MPSNLPEEVTLRLARLKEMLRAAAGRSLTAGEHEAVELLIQSLRELLGPDLTDLLDC